jgi:hypothetical protein
LACSAQTRIITAAILEFILESFLLPVFKLAQLSYDEQLWAPSNHTWFAAFGCAEEDVLPTETVSQACITALLEHVFNFSNEASKLEFLNKVDLALLRG